MRASGGGEAGIERAPGEAGRAFGKVGPGRATGTAKAAEAAAAVEAAEAAAASDGAALGAVDVREGVLGLDPRTHVLAVAAFGVASVVLVGLLETALLQAAAALYLAGNGRARLALRSCASFAVVCGLSFLPLPGLYGVLFVSLMHMVPPFTAGCALFSLSPSAIMCALARWRVPRRALVGVCMLFRFASALPFEARSIVRGIRMRGIFPRALDAVLHPALVYECLYTPLVMRCLRLSAELAASAELRGIEADGRRTSVHHVGLGARDALVAAAVVAVCVGLCAGEGLA